MEKRLIKAKLLEASKKYLQEKIENLEVALKSAKESGNDETKSTTGDKHETGKAMMQLEQEKIGHQLQELQKTNKVLDGISAELSERRIIPGNVVITNQGKFYISIAAGKITLDNEVYFAISAISPLGMMLLRAKKGESVNLLEKKYQVQDTF